MYKKISDVNFENNTTTSIPVLALTDIQLLKETHFISIVPKTDIEIKVVTIFVIMEKLVYTD